jgi:hypothetical protein
MKRIAKTRRVGKTTHQRFSRRTQSETNHIAKDDITTHDSFENIFDPQNNNSQINMNNNDSFENMFDPQNNNSQINMDIKSSDLDESPLFDQILIPNSATNLENSNEAFNSFKKVDNKIFTGHKVSKSEASIYVFAFMTRHNLTTIASEELIKLIQFLLPNNNFFPKSLNKLHKEIGFEKAEINVKEYCQKCRLLFMIGPLNVDQNESDFCGCLNEDDQRNFDSFLYLNVYDKISFLVDQFFDSIHQHFSSQKSCLDIIDGEFYKSIANENTLNLMICADGTPIRNTSNKKEFWPVILSLVELPLPLRDSIKNKIICGNIDKH